MDKTNEKTEELSLNIMKDVSEYFESIESDFNNDNFYKLKDNYGLPKLLEEAMAYIKKSDDTQYYLHYFLVNLNESLSAANERKWLISYSDLITLDLFLGDLDYIAMYSSVILPEEIMFSLREKVKIFSRDRVSSGDVIKQRIFNNDSEISMNYDKYLKEFNFKPLDSLKVDQLFGIRAIDLLTLNFYETSNFFETSKKNRLGWYIMPSSLINTSPALKNTLLMFIYLGDNKAMEYYTGKIVNIEALKGDRYLNYKGYSSISDFMLPLSKIKESPFVICEDEERKYTQFFEVDETFKLEFAKQDKDNIKKIVAAINVMEDYFSDKLNEKLRSICIRDYELAQRIDSVEAGIIKLRKKAKDFIDESK